ncbi:MAG: hypothetical protein ACI9LO_002672 [Planctomycetota bacterium]|jgi:hypothetical protein
MEISFQLKTATSVIAGLMLLTCQLTIAETLPIIDTHIHYSHDAWQRIPPEEALEKLRAAGLRKVFVSSSSDEGTQMLYRLAPGFIVPVLRPYRKRGETSSWMRDESVLPMLSRLLETNNYAGIGEFHASGDDIDLPVLQAVIALAQKHELFLHAHVDADAIERIFKSDANARVLWAHSGFESPAIIADLLEKYPGLRADLAFRNDHELDGMVEVRWQALFERFPDRFVLGTDTYTPERWYYLSDQAQTSRTWLGTLDKELAERIAYRNAEQLLQEVGFK